MLAALVGAGCGSQQDYANDPRPPVTTLVSAYVSDSRVAVSPTMLGAGPIELIVTNQSARSRELIIEGPDGVESPCTRQRTATGPINPQGTAEIKVIVQKGACSIGVRGGGPRAVFIHVTGRRPSAQNRVLLP